MNGNSGSENLQCGCKLTLSAAESALLAIVRCEARSLASLWLAAVLGSERQTQTSIEVASQRKKALAPLHLLPHVRDRRLLREAAKDHQSSLQLQISSGHRESY